MLPDRNREEQEILAMVDHYLAGEIAVGEVVKWATLKLSEEKLPQETLRIQDHIIGNALGALMMLSESEPEEYRTTQDELLQARSYLIGEEPFPLERIPKRN